MKTRPIDANALQELCNRGIQNMWNTGVAPVSWAAAYADFKNDIDSIPTLTPPNELLTLEQLREMDGEPVWVEDVKHWALIDIEKGGQWDGVPFAIWAENGTKFTYNVESRGLHCYRRPPEGCVCYN